MIGRSECLNDYLQKQRAVRSRSNASSSLLVKRLNDCCEQLKRSRSDWSRARRVCKHLSFSLSPCFCSFAHRHRPWVNRVQICHNRWLSRSRVKTISSLSAKANAIECEVTHDHYIDLLRQLAITNSKEEREREQEKKRRNLIEFLFSFDVRWWHQSAAVIECCSRQMVILCLEALGRNHRDTFTLDTRWAMIDWRLTNEALILVH